MANSEELKEIVEKIIGELDKIFKGSSQIVAYSNATICIPYQYAERLVENETLTKVETILLKTYQARKITGFNRAILSPRKSDLSLIEVTFLR